MKRFNAAAVCTVIVLFIFSGCVNVSEPDSNTTDATETAQWQYSDALRVFEVKPKTLSVLISGLPENRTVYLAKINPTASVISKDYTRYVRSEFGLSEAVSASVSSGRAVSDSGEVPAAVFPGQQIRNFVPPQTFGGKESFAAGSGMSAARTITLGSTSSAAVDYTVGAAKSVYIDTDSKISSFARKRATLRAKGTYCYVWVVDDYYADPASGSNVDSSVAEKFAEKFDDMYQMIQNVFGNESDKILATYSASTSLWNDAPMAEVCDTGTKINIVVYDLAGGDAAAGNLVGYFYAKDYFPDETDLERYSNVSYPDSDVRAYSNEGKYFYIDSWFANNYPDETYSTLAHEFQHMINWNMKNFTRDIKPSTWYNEMLSMLCEDMMQDQLGISDDNSPKYRFPTFCRYYRNVGLEYRTTDDDGTDWTSASYAAAYAFGAWCARQFGGAALIREISENNSVDTDSVIAAINTLNHKDYTLQDLLKMYAEACVFSNTALDMPSFNKKAAQTLTYSSSTPYAYPMTAVNLWDSAYKYPVLTDSVTGGVYCNTTDGTGVISGHNVTYLLGPALYPASSSFLFDIRPCGFTLHRIGITSSSDDVTVTFSSSGSSREVMYLMVQ